MTINRVQTRHDAAQDLRRWAQGSDEGMWREALNLRSAYGNLTARALTEGYDGTYWAIRHSLIDRYIHMRSCIFHAPPAT